MCFFLKVGEKFYAESIISHKLNELVSLAENGQIDLSATEGAVSIKFHGEEILGIDFWDEICFIFDHLISTIDTFLQGDPIEDFLPMQSAWLRLSPAGNSLKYELLSEVSTRPVHIKRAIPKSVFLPELYFLYARIIRILAMLGSRSYSELENQWRTMLWKPELSVFMSYEKFKRVFDDPLESILQGADC